MMTVPMIICGGCNWAHRSALAAAECQETHDLEAAEMREWVGSTR